MSYWACVVARNASSHIRATIDSLLTQSLGPKVLVVVNDGSTDATAQILGDYQQHHGNLLRALDLPDNGYDIRRVPRNINLACTEVGRSGVETDFFMISGDDCSYPVRYAESIISRMQSRPKIVVASGRPTSDASPLEGHSPSGSGRIVSSPFWHRIGGKYPVKAGWETWLLYKALESGLQVRFFNDLVFHHARPRGAIHQFMYWGAAMYALGYNPLYAIGRIAKNAVRRRVSVRASLNTLRGYLQASQGSSDPFMSPFDEPLRSFVAREQGREIPRRIGVRMKSSRETC